MTTRVGRALRSCALLGVLALVSAACNGETAVITTTTSKPATTTSTTLPPDPSVDGPMFRVGMTGRLGTTNWWAALDAEPASESSVVLANTKSALFTLSRPGFALVPALAATVEPAAPTQQGAGWAVEQTIREDVTWSDGEPVTADDLVFYFDVVREFGLGGSHGGHFPAAVTSLSAVDEHTVRVEFASAPTPTEWQTGVALAPLVPAHFWEPHVAAAREAAGTAFASTTDEVARAAVAASSLGDDDPDNDVAPEDVAPEDAESHRQRVAAEAGQGVLYAADPAGEPSAGPLILESWDTGQSAVTRSNPGFFARGTETVVYSDGSVRVADPGLGDNVFGGSAAGEVTAHAIVGPFVSGIEWLEHGSAEEAYDSLRAGEVDYVLDPDGMGYPTYNELAGSDDIALSISPGQGFRYLGFNLRKPPMSDPVFRHAVASVVDKELLAETLFNGTLFPAYTVVHPDLTTFYADDVDRPGWSGGSPMSTPDRYRRAIDLLGEAGYSWDVQPEVVFDEAGNFIDIVPGQGLEMPNGVDVPPLTLVVAPEAEDDPMRATVALWVAKWMTDLGMVVDAEMSGFGSAVDSVLEPDSFEASLSWDLHVLGWGAPDIALPGHTLVALFHSRNGVEGGGLNATGYASSEFDAAADAFVAATSMEEAARLTKEMERIVAADLPYLTLFRAPVIEGYGSHVEFPVDAIMGGHGSIPLAWPESVRIAP
jgi:peptide/nickel transport system substrate-binding protein